VIGALTWLRRWGISLASFAGGLVTLFVLRRDLPHAAWIIGYVVLLGLVVAVLSEVREALEARGRRFVVGAAEYLIQSLYHGALLFLLPAYWASTTVTSPNVGFFALLVALALIATFDPWYRALVQRRPWAKAVFFVVSVFGALNVALPLVGVPPRLALPASAYLAVLAVTPAVRRARGWPWLRAASALGLLAVIAAWTAHAGRMLVPPAPLSLGRGALVRAVVDGEPVGRFERSISVAEVRENGALVAYTPIHAPSGLRQPVAHVWRLRGRIVGVVTLSPVRGGRREGFRTYSRKTVFPADAVGPWSVDVVTESGQLIGRLRFRMTP
jgi:uncharacterized protein DUF5924/DUF2914 family protein